MTWNIHGLKCSVADVDFIKYIADYDIVCLSETWLKDTDTFDYSIRGYECDHLPANKPSTRKKGRHSGGISIYYKEHLKGQISIVEKSTHGFILLKIKSELFSHGQNVYLCSVYFPPNQNNTRINDEEDNHFDLLESLILKYERLGKLYISGDFNARTGNSQYNDILQHDAYLQGDENEDFNVPARVNRDLVVDVYRRRLLGLCRMTGLVIANGRLSHDASSGEFTFCSQQGQSTVDYLLSSYEDLTRLHDFKIMPFESFSDHARLLMKLQTLLCMKPSETPPLQTVHNKLVWNNEHRETYWNAISENMSIVNDLTSDLCSARAPDNLNVITEKFTDLLYNKALPLFNKRICINNKESTHNVWFNDHCKRARSQFNNARNVYNKHKSEVNRTHFTRLRTLYN